MLELTMTSAELGRRSGISDGLIRQWISGNVESPGVKKLNAVAMELGVTPTWLVSGDGPKCFDELDFGVGYLKSPEAQPSNQDPALTIPNRRHKDPVSTGADAAEQILRGILMEDLHGLSERVGSMNAEEMGQTIKALRQILGPLHPLPLTKENVSNSLAERGLSIDQHGNTNAFAVGNNMGNINKLR